MENRKAFALAFGTFCLGVAVGVATLNAPIIPEQPKAKAAVAAPATPAPSLTGAWNPYRGKDSMTDHVFGGVLLDADEPVSDVGGQFATPQINIQCAAGSKDPYIEINFHKFVGSDDIHMQFRIDQGMLDGADFRVDKDHEKIFIFGSDESKNFIRKMLSARSLRIRIFPQFGEPIETVFTPTGLAEAMKPLHEWCPL